MHDFKHHRAKDTKDAIGALNNADDGKYLAGGQTLIPVMKQGLAMPSDMIDLGGIPDLKGISVDGEAEARTLLSQFLRETLNLTGTHVGCDTSQCGACVVHLNGVPVKSCAVFAVQADGAEVATIEGVATGDTLHPMQEAFRDNHGLQCGFCTPGMVMTALAMVKDNPDPSDADIRHGLEGNLCRCTGYQNIVKAVLAGAKAMRG